MSGEYSIETSYVIKKGDKVINESTTQWYDMDYETLVNFEKIMQKAITEAFAKMGEEGLQRKFKMGKP